LIGLPEALAIIFAFDTIIGGYFFMFAFGRFHDDADDDDVDGVVNRQMQRIRRAISVQYFTCRCLRLVRPSAKFILKTLLLL
jgi:hypothetical protein